MEDIISVPELSLYAFTNKKYHKTTIFPHDGKEIIRQRIKSSNIGTIKHSKQTVRGSTNTYFQQERPLSMKPKRYQSSKGFVTRVQTPAYTLTRSASAVEMKINVKKFFKPPVMEYSPTVAELIGSCICKEHGTIRYNEKLKDPLDIIQRITKESVEREEELQKEIVEMGINIKKQKRDFEIRLEELVKEKNEMQMKFEKQYNADRKYLKGLHEKEMKLISKQCQDDLCQQKLHFLAQKAHYDEEIEQYKKLVQETKREMRHEAEVRLNALEVGLRNDHNEKVAELQSKIKEQRDKIAEEVKAEISEVYDKEIETLIMKYESQIQSLKARETLANELADQVTLLKGKLQLCNETNKCLKDEVENVTAEKRNEELKLLKTSRDLKELKENFSEKLQTFKCQYMEQWDDLRLENSQLRGRIIKLTEDTSRYHSDIDRINVHGLSRKLRLATALKARQRANLSLVKHSSPTEEASRRCTSAPGTEKESRSVETTALENEVKELSRPNTTYKRK